MPEIMPSDPQNTATVGRETGTPRPRRFTLARFLTIGYLAAGVGGGLAEIGARVADKVRQGIPYDAAPDFNVDLMLRDSLGPRGKPNGRYQHWMLNSAGFRSPESELTPVKGCVRVMTIGSSETFGSTAEPAGKEFPAQLRDSLRRRGCYQVLNAGIVGISIRGLIQSWTRWGSRFHPDIVVILANPTFYLGDSPPTFPKALPPRQSPPWWTSRLPEKARDLIVFPDIIQEWRIQRQLAEIASRHAPGWEFPGVPLDRLAQYREDLDSLLAVVLPEGTTPILVPYPIRAGDVLSPSDRTLLFAQRTFGPRARPDVMISFDRAAARVVRETAHRTGVPIVDLPPLMNGRPELFEDMVHYSIAGSAFVAGKIAPVVHDVAEQRRHSPSARP